MRPLTAEDATAAYADWLNDPLINRYLETRYSTQTVETCRTFIEDSNADPNSHLFGIFRSSTDGAHIGNVKLGFVNQRYRTAQLSLFIGDRSAWGSGYAREVIRRVSRHGFDDLSLIKLEAGCYEHNLGSLRAFLSVGYVVEGFFRSHVEIEGDRQGCFWMGALSDDVS